MVENTKTSTLEAVNFTVSNDTVVPSDSFLPGKGTSNGLQNPEVITFVYGGFGPREGLNGQTLNEHNLLRNPQPRFVGHYLHKYTLPDVDSSGLVYDSRFTTDKGWDDKTPEVMERYMKLASYAGINTMAFALYGGIELDKTKFVMMEETLRNFNKIQKDFPKMSFAPMICAALPRLSLPISVPIKENEDYRFKFIGKESFEFMARYVLEEYYAKKPESYLTIEGRPVIFLFDYIRIAIDKRFGLTTDTINSSLDTINEFSKKNFSVDPYYIAIVNNAHQAKRANDFHIDLISNYIDLPYFNKSHTWPIQDYSEVTRLRRSEWQETADKSSVPFVPALVSGFDATSRVDFKGKGKSIDNTYPSGNWYPLIPVVPNNPNRAEKFKEYIRSGINRSHQMGLPFINFGPLNEMTEQCSLLPTYTSFPEEPNSEILDVAKRAIKSIKVEKS